MSAGTRRGGEGTGEGGEIGGRDCVCWGECVRGRGDGEGHRTQPGTRALVGGVDCKGEVLSEAGRFFNVRLLSAP